MNFLGKNCSNRGDWSGIPERLIDNMPLKAFSWGKECLNCFHCKTKSFTDFELCREWTEYKGHIVRKGWKTLFLKNKGKITLYWCFKDGTNKAKATVPGVGRIVKYQKCDFFEGE